MLVVDASVLAPAIVDGGADGDACRAALVGQQLVAPDLIRIEVMSAIRRQVATRMVTSTQATAAIDDLLDFPVTVFPAAPLLGRCWEMHGNVTTYDACYVALAEALDCELVTADHGLANAPGPRCRFAVV